MPRRRIPRNTTDVFAGVVMLSGEIAYDSSTGRVRQGDGVTAGGHPLARLSEVQQQAAVLATRAAQADLTALSTVVAGKAPQTQVTGLASAVAALQAVSGAAGTTKVVATVAALAGITGMANNDRAEVRADPLGDVTNGNGVWRYNAGTSAWVWLSSLFPAGAVGAFQDAVLAPSRTLPTGKNKFRSAKVTEGTEIYGDGTLSPQPDSSISEPIWVAGEPSVFIKGVQAHSGSAPYGRWLGQDAETVIGPVFSVAPGATGAAYAPPPGAFYVQFSPRQRTGGAASYGALQVEYGSTGTSYEAPTGSQYLTLADDPIYQPPVQPTFAGDINLFNPAAVVTGYEVYSDGTLSPQADSVISGLIDVRSLRRVTIGGMPANLASNRYWRILAADGSTVVAKGQIPAAQNGATIAIPRLGAWFQFSPRQRQPGGGAFTSTQVEAGALATTFQTFVPRVAALNARPIGERAEMSGRGGIYASVGDSITATRSIVAGDYTVSDDTVNWPTFARDYLKADAWHSYAVSGSSWRHRVGLTAYQKMSEQVTRLIADVPKLDRIIFSAGTNDSTADIGTYAAAMAKGSLGALDQTKLYEALRWCFWTIRTAYPNVRGWAVLPIQRASVDPVDEKPMYDAIRQMAERYGFRVIDATSHSGIVRDFETVGAPGRYLADGLHPTPVGSQLLADLIESEIRRTAP